MLQWNPECGHIALKQICYKYRSTDDFMYVSGLRRMFYLLDVDIINTTTTVIVLSSCVEDPLATECFFLRFYLF